MEFTETQIARLVLGYLKSENCKPVYREFLRTSPHLRDEALGGRVIVTRVFGMRLIDYLNEYTEIYTIVQGKLEGTDYFNEHSRGTLVEQILYLLDKINCSRSSTPCTSTPFEHSSDVEATPAHTLPGNVGYDDSDSPRTPKRVACSPGDDPETIEVLARTLLENREFTEKLAHTINVVRNSPEFVDKKIEEHICAGACEELEETIRTVVRKTEEDPLFEKILDEIIGPQPLNTSREKSCQNTQNLNLQTMEEQNNEAIRSIIVASSSQQKISNQSSTYNPDVIVFDGNMDNYIKTNNSAVPTPVQQNYTNTGLFVVPSKKYDPSKQILVVNQPIVNMPKNQPANTIISEQDILAMPTVILNDGGQNASVVTSQPPIFITKPTYTTTNKPVPIIPNGLICDELHSNLGEFIKIYKSEEIPSSSVKTIKTIPPRVRAKSSKKKAPPPKTNSVKTKTITSASIHVTLVPEETPETKEEPPTVKTEPEQPPINDVPVISPEIKIEDKKSPEEPKENSTNKVQTAKNQSKTPQSRVFSKRNTPKSGSHVRNLNFSTPPKISSSERKRNADKSASPKFVHKKQQAAKTLFKNEGAAKKSPNKVVTRGPKPEWDSALRALACTGSEDLKSATPKRKQKQPPERGKRKTRKTDSKLNASLDKEALLLEAALKTPIKEPPVDKPEIPKVKKEEPLTTIAEEESVKTTEEMAVDVDKNIIVDKLNSVEDNATKTILSPSKLNANKRNLVKAESKNQDDPHKLITPEMRDLKKDNPNFPIKANRNITPMLETPMKVDILPKTPGLGTPLTGFTPLNKVLEDQLNGLDLNSIETPNLPITPGFPPFTPNVDLTTPYSNRPTDYSGSSSYYQPSDTEQNKSIEQLLEETSKKTTAPKKSTIKILDNVVIEPKVVLDNIVNNFNKNVIGKKNLNLLNKSSIKYSSSSDSESESSTDEGTTNQTVICKKENITKEPTKTYSLRTRSSNNIVKDPETERTSEISNILNSVGPLSLESKPIKIMSHNEKVMLEMKEKRERMINKFKKSEIQKVEKPVNRSKRKLPQRGIKSVPQRKNRRKSDSPKKAINRTRRSTSLEEESPKFDKSFVNDFHLTSDEESEQPTKMETRSRRAKNVEEAAKVTTQEAETASDMEAEKLVSGLKQRGIHLMYKKSPKNLIPVPNATTQEEIKETKVVAESPQTPPKRIYSINEIDELDKVLFDQEIHIVFDETKPINKKEYDSNILTKKVSAKVYCEEEGIDIPVEITAGPFISLLEFESKINVLIPKRKDSSKKEGDVSRSNDLNETNQKSNDGESQKHSEEVLTAVSLDVTTDDSNSSPKSFKKRKAKTEDESQLAKKSKTVENIKILKDLDVDVFLNKVHGRSENVT